MTRKCRLYCFVLSLITFITIWIVLNGLSKYDIRILKHRQTDSRKRISIPVVLWWTPFTGLPDTILNCSNKLCLITQNRLYKDYEMTKAMLFYGSNLDYTDLPLPRRGSSVSWALLHEESPKNTPVLVHEEMLSLFNFTSTFSRHSHSPLTLLFLEDINMITSTKYFVPTDEKNKLLSQISPVLYVQSDCDAPSERDEYVRELRKYVSIDSYGECLNNKKLPKILVGSNNRDSHVFYELAAKYKFTLAFENAVCDDYITEKLWRPLYLGSVPIYMGSPSIRDWLPNNDSAILVSDFLSAKELAKKILEINSDDKKYNSFLKHKIGKTKVSNKNLIKKLESRGWSIDNDPTKMNFIEYFECFVCWKLHIYWIKNSLADLRHYNCPAPVSHHTGGLSTRNWWHYVIWFVGKCEAKAIRNFVDNGSSIITEYDFRKEIIRLCPKLSL